MFEAILAKIAAALTSRSVPYMIIGGQAVLLYGEPRMTRDIDITLGVNTDHLEVLLSILRETGLSPLPKDVNAFVNETMVLPASDTSGIRVDFIFSFTPYEAQAITRAKHIRIKGGDVSFASPEDVIIHKVFAGRPRDLEDVRTILLKQSEIDTAYIRKWLAEFDEASDEKVFAGIFESIFASVRRT